MLTVQNKPTNDIDSLSKYIIEVPNVLNTEQIENLKSYAHSEHSGLHRRGSKDKKTVASFYTCQVHPFIHEIYNILAPVWNIYEHQLSFIEPYEFKSYIEGDLFEYHTDVYFNLEKKVDRKLNLIVQLSDDNDYEGGDLLINNFKCSRKKGTATLFPACLYHCVTPITKGTRYSIIGHGWGPYQI
jgi:predicted 2-oxoglutarate/Fe(II)-dependent dioxygenase YbiX